MFLIAVGVVTACGAILGIDDREGLLPDAAAPSEGGAGADANGNRDSASSDSPSDVVVDAGATFTCVGSGAKVASCASCPEASIGCPPTGQCVGECRDNCATGPMACTTCSGTSATATCAPDKTPAASCPPSACPCSGVDAEACPLDTMVCIGNACTTCGDLGTHDELCKDGTGAAKCKLGDEGDPTKRYRCVK